MEPDAKKFDFKSLPKKEQKIANIICDCTKLGESRYEQKRQTKAACEEAKKEGCSAEEIDAIVLKNQREIHSVSTSWQYIEKSIRGFRWISKNFDGIKSYRDARQYVGDYLLWLSATGLSASTVVTYACAFAKLYNCHSYDFGVELPRRNADEYTRCRHYSVNQYLRDFRRYGDIVIIARCTGPRERELEHITADCFRTAPDGSLYLHLDGKKQQTKHGKTRDVVIQPENQAFVSNFIAQFEPDQRIFPHVPSNLNVHGIRAMYAEDFYAAVARDIAEISPEERTPLKHPYAHKEKPERIYDSEPTIYHRRHDDREFDRRALLMVAPSLGHERGNVVATNYLWRGEKTAKGLRDTAGITAESAHDTGK